MKQEPTLKVGDKVIKDSGDYTFEGEVVSVFWKKSGAVRIVVENPAGILHVFSEKNVFNRELYHMPPGYLESRNK